MPITHRECDGHAARRSPEYMSWRAMWSRCTSEKDVAYPHYGGRGIVVAGRWAKFLAFLDDMGPRPAGTTLDRVDNDGNYEPSNCRWADHRTQHSNTRANRFVTLNGRTETVAQWARETGMSPNVIKARLERGLSPEAALTTPSSRERPITAMGETLSRSEWARRIGIPKCTFLRRLKRMTPEQAILGGAGRMKAIGAR